MTVNNMRQLMLLATLAALGVGCSAMADARDLEKPRLILQITVDQLRGDLPERYYDRLAKGACVTC